MTRNEILEQVQSIFKEVLKSEDVVLTDDTTAQDVNGWDSLTHVTIISEMEKHFGLRFSLREMLSWKSVGKMLDTLEKKLG